MTALELARKITGCCTRCGAPAGDTNLCEPHRVDLAARVAKAKRARRARRRSHLLPGFSTAATAG